MITVRVGSGVDLPLLPSVLGGGAPSFALDATHTVPIGQFRDEPMSRRDERGQATVMIIGLAVVLLMAAVVVVDASAAYLQRQGLDTVADGAALAGADAGSRNLDVLYGEGVGRAGPARPGRDASPGPPSPTTCAPPAPTRRTPA